jgi:hypothetical protein
MRIGVICAAEQRFEVLRDLLPEHQLVRLSTAEAHAGNGPAGLDLVFADIAPAGGGQPRAGEEDVPCLLRLSDDGRVQLQCGRQEEAKRRAATTVSWPRTTTLIFQRADAAPPEEQPLRLVCEDPCHS